MPAHKRRPKGSGPDLERARLRRDLWKKQNTHRYPRYKKAYQLKAQYGLSLEAFEAMKYAQNNLCAVCFKPEIGKELAIDHDHDTERVRGLLCQACNTALGLLGDDLSRIESLAAYKRKHSH